jgi:hypothetical protein
MRMATCISKQQVLSKGSSRQDIVVNICKKEPAIIGGTRITIDNGLRPWLPKAGGEQLSSTYGGNGCRLDLGVMLHLRHSTCLPSAPVNKCWKARLGNQWVHAVRSCQHNTGGWLAVFRVAPIQRSHDVSSDVTTNLTA